MDKDMMRALEADAEKLRQITGDDSHQVEFLDEPDFCDRCGRPFNLPDIDGVQWSQHPRLFMFCEGCGDEMEDEADA